VFYVWRDSIRIHERGAAAALLSLVVAMAVSHQAFRISLHLLLPYLLFCGAYLPRRFAARFAFETDLSYGIYIYAFPVQQLIQHSLPHCTWWQNVLLALPVTLALAAASWFLIERPAMSMIRQRRTVSRSQHSVPVDSSTKPAHNSTRIAA
jgi:peptidoglycan/LPS O-acetylase OafA/YrhL